MDKESVSKLNLSDGDIIVVTVPQEYTYTEIHTLSESMKRMIEREANRTGEQYGIIFIYEGTTIDSIPVEKLRALVNSFDSNSHNE